MKISINQPAYLPWPGYFERIALSDLHIVLDHVQFEKNSLVNRNKIRTSNGWSWLTVPLKTKNNFGNLQISKLEICNNTNWASKHFKSLKINYTRSAYIKSYIEFFNDLYSKEWTFFCPLVNTLNTYILESLNIKTPILYSSSINIQHSKSLMILEICKKFEASCYLSGPFGRSYLDEKIFRENNIEIQYHDYTSKEYLQAYSGFEPYMSVIDLLFNCGPHSSNLLLS